jgi:hypothetical protein
VIDRHIEDRGICGYHADNLMVLLWEFDRFDGRIGVIGHGKASEEDQGDEIELRPDGWERFGKAVDAAVKSGPKHRTIKKPGVEKKPKPK